MTHCTAVQEQSGRRYGAAAFVLCATQRMTDIMYGDCFSVLYRYDVRAAGPTACALKVGLQVAFSKSIFVPGVQTGISSTTAAETGDMVRAWVDGMRAHIQSRAAVSETEEDAGHAVDAAAPPAAAAAAASAGGGLPPPPPPVLLSRGTPVQSPRGGVAGGAAAAAPESPLAAAAAAVQPYAAHAALALLVLLLGWLVGLFGGGGGGVPSGELAHARGQGARVHYSQPHPAYAGYGLPHPPLYGYPGYPSYPPAAAGDGWGSEGPRDASGWERRSAALREEAELLDRKLSHLRAEAAFAERRAAALRDEERVATAEPQPQSQAARLARGV
jgi:hypothetical protein